MAQYRIERDLLGEKCVPKDAYYGIQTIRAVENFPITGYSPHPELIKAFGFIKKACALANLEIGALTEEIAGAIVTASEEVIAGKFNDSFIIDAIQGGAGTSFNMNANEVIANRAIELLDGEKGSYIRVSPNTHVNMAQSTNDTFPTAIRIACLRLIDSLLEELNLLIEEMKDKEHEFDSVLKMGRTHLQDAVPIKLGQEFGAYQRVLSRDLVRIKRSLQSLYSINMGATAIGTGLNAEVDYIKK